MGLIRRLTPKNLFQRALLLIVAPLITAQTIVACVFFVRYWSSTTERLSAAVGADIRLLLESWDARADPDMDALDALARRGPGLSVIRLDRFRTEPPRRSWGPLLDDAVRRGLRERIEDPFIVETVRYPAFVAVTLPADGGAARFLIPKARLEARTGAAFLVWMAGASAAVAAVAAIFLHNQVKPVKRLAEAAEAFGKGLDVEGFKPSGASEVRRAAAAFLQMRARLRRHIAQRTALLAGVGHDLRTPLARLKLEAEMRADCEAMRADLREMEAILEDYLAFARGQAEATGEFRDVMAIIRDAAAGAPRPIAVFGPGALILEVRPVPLKRCLANLMENACRHGETVEVRVEEARRAVDICVDDDGPGIAAERRADALAPFSALGGSGSTGLGLAIARDIARAHGGDLHLENATLGGLRARVRLPR